MKPRKHASRGVRKRLMLQRVGIDAIVKDGNLAAKAMGHDVGFYHLEKSKMELRDVMYSKFNSIEAEELRLEAVRLAQRR